MQSAARAAERNWYSALHRPAFGYARPNRAEGCCCCGIPKRRGASARRKRMSLHWLEAAILRLRLPEAFCNRFVAVLHISTEPAIASGALNDSAEFAIPVNASRPKYQAAIPARLHQHLQLNGRQKGGKRDDAKTERRDNDPMNMRQCPDFKMGRHRRSELPILHWIGSSDAVVVLTWVTPCVCNNHVEQQIDRY